MPVRLQNALATFQQAINVTLAFAKLITASVHLEEIKIFSNISMEHIACVKEFLMLLQKAEVNLKLID